jgi:hypothetical protein
VSILLEVFDALPETDEDECDYQLSQGNYVRASFLCPAGDFLGALFSSSAGEEEEEEEP